MRTQPPWEANRHFDAPKETTFALVGTTAIQVASANPMRVVLILGVPSSSTAGVNFTTNSGASSVNVGFCITPTVGAMVLAHSDVGALASDAWYAIGGASGQFATVIEINLHDWPVEDPDDTADVRDKIDWLGEMIKLLGAKPNGAADRQLYPAQQGAG